MITVNRAEKSMTITGSTLDITDGLPDLVAFEANAAVNADAAGMNAGGIVTLVSDLMLVDPRERMLSSRDIWGRQLSPTHYVPAPNRRDAQIAGLVHRDTVPERKIFQPTYDKAHAAIMASSLPANLKKARQALSNADLRPERAVSIAGEAVEEGMGELVQILTGVFANGPAKRFGHYVRVLTNAVEPAPSRDVAETIRRELRAAEVRTVSRGMEKPERIALLHRLALAGSLEGMAAMIDDPLESRVEPDFVRRVKTEMLKNIAPELAHLLDVEPGYLVGIAARLDLVAEIVRQSIEEDLFDRKSGLVLKVSKPRLGVAASSLVGGLAETFDL